jgi:hypothetical protein
LGEQKEYCGRLNMSTWSFVAVLHNLSLEEPVENDYLAIVPEADSRATELIERNSTIRQLVTGFTDQFGRPASPSLFLVHPEAPPELLDQDALISFRNSLAICSITYALQKSLVQQLSLNVLRYSDYFNIYPITVGRDENVLIIRSPAILGMDEPDEFVGQISPELASSYRVSGFYDSELLSAIFDVWRGRFVDRNLNDWRSRVLFRSLEMAYHAASIPFENSSSIYDYGAKVALWVSAFEVLLRPETEKASLSRVLEFLAGMQLYSRGLKHRRYTLAFSQRNRSRGTLSQKLYLSMHNARNAFLHGNPVGVEDLFVNRHTEHYPLTTCAPILYKQALQSFLNLHRLEDISSYSMEMYADIRNFEEAISALGRRRPQRERPTKHSIGRRYRGAR